MVSLAEARFNNNQEVLKMSCVMEPLSLFGKRRFRRAEERERDFIFP